MNVLRIPTAVIPLCKPSRSIRLRRTAIPARTPTDKDIERIVLATFEASLPPSRLIRSIKPMIPVNSVKATMPLRISSGSNLARSATTPTRRYSDTDIARSDVPSLVAFFPASLVAMPRSEITPANAVSPIIPIAISSGSIIAKSLITPIRRYKETEILSIALPNEFAFCPAIPPTSPSRVIRLIRAAIATPP